MEGEKNPDTTRLIGISLAIHPVTEPAPVSCTSREAGAPASSAAEGDVVITQNCLARIGLGWGEGVQDAGKALAQLCLTLS